jgi:hypothetical protein
MVEKKYTKMNDGNFGYKITAKIFITDTEKDDFLSIPWMLRAGGGSVAR